MLYSYNLGSYWIHSLIDFLINQQDLFSFFRFFMIDKWSLNIGFSCVVEKYQCNFLKCMVSKRILQYASCKTLQIV